MQNLGDQGRNKTKTQEQTKEERNTVLESLKEKEQAKSQKVEKDRGKE